MANRTRDWTEPSRAAITLCAVQIFLGSENRKRLKTAWTEYITSWMKTKLEEAICKVDNRSARKTVMAKDKANAV